MKKNKDRSIRITNIPDREILYSSYEKTSPFLIVVLLMGFIATFQSHNFIVALLTFFIFLLLVTTYKRELNMEICKDCILSYVDDTFAIIIYYDEVLSYHISKTAKVYTVTLLLKDDSQYIFKFTDQKVSDVLKSVIGERNVNE